MRYIGSKVKVLDFLNESIATIIPDLEGKIFADLFAGTTAVSKNFRGKGCKIISNDYMAFSYALQIANIKLNDTPRFNNLKVYNLFSYLDVISHLNKVKPIKGFFYSHLYPLSRKDYRGSLTVCLTDSIKKPANSMFTGL